jgi:hypothetical protein
VSVVTSPETTDAQAGCLAPARTLYRKARRRCHGCRAFRSCVVGSSVVRPYSSKAGDLPEEKHHRALHRRQRHFRGGGRLTNLPEGGIRMLNVSELLERAPRYRKLARESSRSAWS